MNGNGEFNPQAEDYGYLRGELVSGFELGSPFPAGWYPDISVGPFLPNFAAYSQLPAVRVLPTIPPADVSDTSVAGDEALPPVVVDPEVGTQTTVYEGKPVPDGIYETNRAPTDWGRVYDEYVVLNAPQAPQGKPQVQVPVPEVNMPVDWGSVGRTVLGEVVGGYLDPFGAGRATTDFFGMAAPTTVTGIPSLGQQGGTVTKIDPRTGKPVCRRRRRRRLLTDSDFNDLMRISTLPNKDIVKIALAKAVGR